MNVTKTVRIIGAVLIFIVAFLAKAPSVHAEEISKVASYKPFTILCQIELIEEDQLILAIKNKKEQSNLLITKKEEVEKIAEQKRAEEKQKNQSVSAVKKATASSQTYASQHPSSSTAKKANKTLTVTATAYTAYCKGCSGTTAYGINLRKNPHVKVIAVDPKVIPLGSKVYVPGYGEALAGDTGGAIKGNRIDVFIPSKTKALQWGRKQVTIEILSTP